jgi:hypothetical protein
MSKVRCGICGNEKGGLCLIKKGKVKLNKPRHCEAFMYDEAKLKVKQDIPYIRMGYAETQNQKKIFKQELKRLREQMKEQIATPPDKVIAPTSNQAYPLTGDLSRFLTTAQKKQE